MLRQYVYGVFPKNPKIIAEERFYERLHNNNIINDLWRERGIEIYDDDDGYLVDVYMVLGDIEWYYSEYVAEYPTRKTINDVVDYFVDRIEENEDYYAALALSLPIQIK